MVAPHPPPFASLQTNHGGLPKKSYGYSYIATDTRDLWDRLFHEGYGADVCVHTDDGGVIHAHASILGIASPVLKNMLKQSKGWPRSIAIRGVTHGAARAFIRYIYSSCYDQREMEEFALHLLVLSHVFLIPSLKRECVRHFEMGLITLDNLVDVFQLAHYCDAPRLRLISHRLIMKSFKAVSATDGWRVMKQSHPELEKELVESLIEDDLRKQEKLKKIEEKKIYLRLSEAMEALLHICRDGCRTIGPHNQALKGDDAPCNFTACKGLEQLIRHFASCKDRATGGCIHCKRMWQLLELHSRMCGQPDVCRVPLCRHFKIKKQSQNKKDEAKWKLLVSKVLAAKNTAGTSLFPSPIITQGLVNHIPTPMYKRSSECIINVDS